MNKYKLFIIVKISKTGMVNLVKVLFLGGGGGFLSLFSEYKMLTSSPFSVSVNNKYIE